MNEKPLLSLRKSKLHIYNTLSSSMEEFQEVTHGHVGMYLCGPTVYGHAHLGNCRNAVFFDVVNRYFRYLGYKVRYVRNITDVGHMEQYADAGGDVISRQARIEQLEPMEVVQTYTNSYHHFMRSLNNLSPDIEPTATGHIVEQIELTKKILDAGFAYESDGNVYFDINKYNEVHPYGELSGRVLEDLLVTSRKLDGTDSKRFPLDFALWKKAEPEHIMRWPSPWGEGFPGWHLECSAMSTKYLGDTFDIHGGGMDLKFPHHECEIAQSKAGIGKTPAKYWMHNNMVTINGQKMAKSLGNFINMLDMFSGKHELLEQAYSPMTVRMFLLQAQYRSTVDVSNDALKAASKAYRKLMNGVHQLQKMEAAGTEVNTSAEQEIRDILSECLRALDEDVNTAACIASLFGLLKKINNYYNKPELLTELSEETFNLLKTSYTDLVTEILGFKEETETDEVLIKALIAIYADAKAEKNYAVVDKIRQGLSEGSVQIRDTKRGIDWGFKE